MIYNKHSDFVQRFYKICRNEIKIYRLRNQRVRSRHGMDLQGKFRKVDLLIPKQFYSWLLIFLAKDQVLLILALRERPGEL